LRERSDLKIIGYKDLRTTYYEGFQNTGGHLMQTGIDSPLKKVVKGTMIALFGSILGLFLVFLSRIAMARYLSVAEYGIFSLAFVILNVLTVVSLVGLERGGPQRVASYSAKGEMGNADAVIRSSVLAAIIASLVSGVLLFLVSDLLATHAFQTPELGNALRIFSFGIPFFTLLLLLVAAYRGFDRADVKVYFSDILKNVIFIIFIGVALLFQLSFDFVLYGFVISIAVSCLGIVLLTIRKPLVPRESRPPERPRGIPRELLLFSLPLLASAIFTMLMSWTDTIALGYFASIDDVGIYNAALPIAQFVPILLNGMSYIYLPVVSKLHSLGGLKEIRRMYVVTTKWVFSLTYPLFLVVVLFPKPVKILFGAAYVSGSVALQVLIIGFFVHTFLGLNASTLLAMGEARFLMWSSAVTAVGNIVLNILLVSSMGIIGAAYATTISLVVLNIFMSSKCYISFRIHPFTRKYLTPILVSIPVIIAIYLAVNLSVGLESVFLLPTFFIVFLIVYFLSVLLTRGFDQEDLDMIASIERKLGFDFKNIKRVLKKFR
jgi:O-antigen/teichoic acid export membrane protein